MRVEAVFIAIVGVPMWVIFEFYNKYLRGVTQLAPRWKRCVRGVDRDLGQALGKVFVEKTFGLWIPQDEINETNLKNTRALAAVVVRLLNERQPPT